jgi:hypothetical protein
VFGIFVGFKLASKQVIWMLQPCHITIAIQMYLLAAPPNKYTNTIFRTHLGLLNGAVLALLFPDFEFYTLPGEVAMFWIEHVLMLVAPIYLLTLGGPYSLEPFSDLTYCALSSACCFFYHVLILHPVSELTGINVNFTLCPPSTLPSIAGGPHYFAHAAWHQFLIMSAIHKMMAIIAPFLMSKHDKDKNHNHLE